MWVRRRGFDGDGSVGEKEEGEGTLGVRSGLARFDTMMKIKNAMIYTSSIGMKNESTLSQYIFYAIRSYLKEFWKIHHT